MCRVLAYLGERILMEDLLYRPDVSFVNQTHQAALLNRLNLAGSGFLAWDSFSERPELPFVYRSTQLPIYDRNLRALSAKLRATCLLGHLRGVPYQVSSIINEQNLHPFLFDNTRLAMAHNGQLARFDEMKFALLRHMKPKHAQVIRGTTDSEWFYALLLSQLDDTNRDLTAGDICMGVVKAFKIIAEVRHALGIRTFSPMNIFLSDGNDLVAVCYTFGLGNYEGLGNDYHPPDEKILRIWYTMGKSYGFYDGEWRMDHARGEATSCIVASEPLTRDQSTWNAVPLQHLVYVRRNGALPSVEVVPLDVE